MTYAADIQAYLDSRTAYEAANAGAGGTLAARDPYRLSWQDPNASQGALLDRGYSIDDQGQYFDPWSNPIDALPQENYSATEDQIRQMMGVPLDEQYQHQYSALTNRGHNAGQFAVQAMTPIRIVNKRGDDTILFSGTGVEGANQAMTLAGQLSKTQGKKANWVIETQRPDGTWEMGAHDAPAKNILGTIADVALPIAGSVLGTLLLPGLGTALGAAIGGAGGSAASGIIQGRSIGDIAKGAAISGLGAYAGGSLFGGALGGGGGGAASGGAGGAAGGAASGAGSGALGGALGGLSDDIIVNGIRAAAPSLLGAGLSGAGGAALGSLATGGNGNYAPDDSPITVTGQPIREIAIPPSSFYGAPGGLAAFTGGASGDPALEDPITVTGERPWYLPPELAAGALAVPVAGAAAMGGDPALEDPITVEGQRPADLGISPEALAAIAAGGGLATGGLVDTIHGHPAEASNGGGISAQDILAATQILNALGGIGGSGGAGAGTGGAGELNSLFGAELPDPSAMFSTANLAPRAMNLTPEQWARYGEGPEQSFFAGVPQRVPAPSNFAAHVPVAANDDFNAALRRAFGARI